MSEAENRKTANHFKDRGPVFRASTRNLSCVILSMIMGLFIAIQFSLQTAEPVQFDIRIALVAWVFAMLGSYMGVFIRTLISS